MPRADKSPEARTPAKSTTKTPRRRTDAGGPAHGADGSGTGATGRSQTVTEVTGEERGPAFLGAQRQLLIDERATYQRQAEELKAQADSLALEHEPGDVQFDEEGGEGGTSSVDRELDLVLSAQARAAIDEIDLALAKIDAGTYGACERCGKDIPTARLQALPYAALCVACKSGGLSSRR